MSKATPAFICRDLYEFADLITLSFQGRGFRLHVVIFIDLHGNLSTRVIYSKSRKQLQYLKWTISTTVSAKRRKKDLFAKDFLFWWIKVDFIRKLSKLANKSANKKFWALGCDLELKLCSIMAIACGLFAKQLLQWKLFAKC